MQKPFALVIFVFEKFVELHFLVGQNVFFDKLLFKLAAFKIYDAVFKAARLAFSDGFFHKIKKHRKGANGASRYIVENFFGFFYSRFFGDCVF